ncbi:MAG TPA: CocE/NonD family hydrolase [Dehalococcoidia bacterium]|nr:CocE/NonD family hydrolase [Dehalococcoidia bacterium]
MRIPSGSLSLEGVLHLPEWTPGPAVVVCHPHPLYGGDMHNGVVLGVCRTAVEEGCVALRFNFRGVGGSEGTYDGGRGERDDAIAAVEWLRSRPEADLSRVCLAGYSFGALVACAAAACVPSLAALVLISPPAAAGDLSIPADTPTLVIAGDADQFAPADALRAAVCGDSRTRLELIEGADHFWWDGAERLFAAVRAFLRETLALRDAG